MAAYVAMEPPGREEETLFVRDGFTLFAFLVPVLWFLWQRMWIEALLALGLTLLLSSLDSLGGMGAPLLSLLVSLLIGLEAPTLRLWNLERRGWRERGAVEADNLADAETRFFLGEEEAPDEILPPSPAPGFGRNARGPVLGLFAGRRGIA